ncbi:MAG TPA: class I adenylate-forming enzyme family protein, partial [Hyphomicrobiales bacterium]|nr:class I adenylate-forming enzyme family protein [Hyphomicrobiales bacterium]
MAFPHPTYLPLEPGQEVATTGAILKSAAIRFPGKTGLICGTRRWTFAKLDSLANQLAHALLAGLAGREGPVAILGANSAEYALAHFAAARAGRCTVNLPTRATAADLVHAINLTRPALLFADTASAGILGEASALFERPPLLVATGAPLPGQDGEFWALLAGHGETAPDIEIDPDGPGAVIFTGGTTGRPKAVLSSQRARAVSAMAAVEDFRITSDTVAGYSVPFTHTAGLFSWFQPAVLAGCTGVIIPKWDPELFMAQAEEHAISIVFAVPSQLAMLLDHPGFEPERLRSLRRIVFGGAPLTRALIERAESAMPWMDCARAYGSTETGHLAAQIRSDRELVYDGYNQPGGRLDIEIFKAPGVPAREGETGEVATRGAHLMTGYLDDPDAQAAFFKTDCSDGSWGWMGDLAVRRNGYFSLVGRSKHMILSGGLNIFPGELEEVLGGHPEIADCVVFGIEDAVWGEVPAAAVVARNSGIDTKAVLQYVAG